MNVKKVYKNYNPEVQEYMSNLIKCLEQDYKDIPDSWRISLDLIADNYNLYLKAKKDIDENGLFRVDKLNRTFKNQAISVMNNAQQMLTKLLSNFALTPMSKSKMKQLDIETDDDILNDLLQ